VTTAGGPASAVDRLLEQLERARGLGFLGPGPVTEHLDHAQGFVAALEPVSGRVLDLGSGGGVPGLPVALARPDLELVLVDASAKRCDFLTAAIETLGLAARCQVVLGRAEVLGRGPLRGTADAVLARSFSSPAATAECAAPFLRVGGRLVVSEPPQAEDRWPAGGLRPLGLAPLERSTSGPRIQVLLQERRCPEAYPRRDGVPAKRPLF
jgi:16S rRNA (guanine527-N7)-methyltransferase